MRITELRNQLSKIGHVYDENELTMIALRGLPQSWKTFRQGVCAQSKLPKLGRLKDDCIQEESMLKMIRQIEMIFKLLQLMLIKGRNQISKGKEGM